MNKYAGVVGISLFVTVTTLIVIAGYRTPGYTISNHTSLNLISLVSFCVLCSIASLFIGYSLLFYVPDIWRLGRVYKFLAFIVSASFFVACVFPNDPNAYTMHDYASWAALYSGFVFAVFLLFRLWKCSTVAHKFSNIFVIVMMLAVFATQVANYTFFRNYVLIHEGAFIASIFFLMLSLIFGKPNHGTMTHPYGGRKLQHL